MRGGLAQARSKAHRAFAALHGGKKTLLKIKDLVLMTIEKANKEDHLVLTEITKRSKAHWGYSQEQIKAWSELLTITEAYIKTHSVYKLQEAEKTLGYYAFFWEEDKSIRLDNMFLLPEYIGKGLG